MKVVYGEKDEQIVPDPFAVIEFFQSESFFESFELDRPLFREPLSVSLNEGVLLVKKIMVSRDRVKGLLEAGQKFLSEAVFLLSPSPVAYIPEENHGIDIRPGVDILNGLLFRLQVSSGEVKVRQYDNVVIRIPTRRDRGEETVRYDEKKKR